MATITPASSSSTSNNSRIANNPGVTVRRWFLVLPALGTLLMFAPAQSVALRQAAPDDAKPTHSDPMDEAIDGGLLYLSRTQTTDGSWPANAGAEWIRPGPNLPAQRVGGDMAVTALAVMAFLSAGHVPGEGRYGEIVANGIRYVVNNQQTNGLLAPKQAGGTEMYYHGICALMLAEVAGMTEAREAEELKRRLESAIAIILAGQRKGTGFGQDRERGGWRYTVTGLDADLSVTGWQVLALRAAKNVGSDIPHERILAANDYVKRCFEARSGGFTYTTYGSVTVPCTGVGILCLELGGKDSHQSPEALKAAGYLLKNPLSPFQKHFFYGVYYTSQAMFQLGDNYWRSYRDDLHKLLLRTNSPNANGSWSGRGFDDLRYGPAYCTAMAVLALTVEYRYLPIYQRFEEPLERDGKE